MKCCKCGNELTTGDAPNSARCRRYEHSSPSYWPLGVPELTVEELHQSRERGLEMRLRHPVFAMLADDIAQMFDEAGATNYVEYTVCSEKYGPMRVCVQRLTGETPAMQNERLRKRIAELEASECIKPITPTEAP